MLDEVAGRRLRVVERMAWYPEDSSPPNFAVGSVHMWFDGGRGVHLDSKSDWTLGWSISAPGDDGWISRYLYDFHGRWVFERPLGRSHSLGSPVCNSLPNTSME